MSGIGVELGSTAKSAYEELQIASKSVFTVYGGWFQRLLETIEHTNEDISAALCVLIRDPRKIVVRLQSSQTLCIIV